MFYRGHVIKELSAYSALKVSQPEVHGLFITPSHAPRWSCMILWCPQILHFSLKCAINSIIEMPDSWISD